MKIGKRNIKNALKRASRYSMLLLTGMSIFMSCSEDSIAPESPPADQIPIMCISYYDNLNRDLKFTMKSGEFWGEPKVVSWVYDVGQWPSLTLDTEGYAHIGYYDATHGTLKYTYENRCNCSWHVETIDFIGWRGSYTSLTLDANGNPHISYYDDTNGSLKHAEKNGGSWIIEAVDNTGPVGRYTSLALDAQGNPHISYRDDSNEALKYASKIDGYWFIESVDSDGSVGWHTSLAIDAQGNPHISYCEQNFDYNFSGNLTGALKYAEKKNGRWECTLIDRANGQYPSLTLDAQGNPHISYYSCDVSCQSQFWTFMISISGVPKYAARIDAFWIIEAVDGSFRDQDWVWSTTATGCMDCYSMVPLCTSIALDARGIPYISYYDWGNGDLKCAMKAGNYWIVDTMDSEGDVGSYSSIATGHR